ncbi:ammonia-forming cytochrome c nitrite reductase subunit c552 [Actinomyces lilanjuaniae]|uniref:nitrite reductase (cytochrome; ammonia-forming) n=1 Tax=Actinomyces lilanjuaniae TaxID=2321394 RepID=A0ABN5PQA8_9ACTO|nr:ammonia-forming cytochrome c nitrite reductase subunit c552 [Actinomyces lilanjuaniae]AYD90593.1 ammonia-forming cytochrome c nitrite reductase subunit c552 [Actinomyces lilanjuaniae]
MSTEKDDTTGAGHDTGRDDSGRDDAATSGDENDTTSATESTAQAAAEDSGKGTGKTGKKSTRRSRSRWIPVVVLVSVAVSTAALTWLLTTIFSHRQESAASFTEVVELTDTSYDPAVWGENFPIQYEQYRQTVEDTDGDFIEVTPTAEDPREYHTISRIESEPRAQRMWRGYAFAVDYTEPRGHEWALLDQMYTERTDERFNQPGACLNCHASTPEIYDELGDGDREAGFEAMNAMDYEDAVEHASSSIACIDCHDPQTMELTITRPAFAEGIREAKAAEGIEDFDVNRDATNQEMRTYVCAQCHVEYYFAGDGKTLTFPWDNGLTVYDAMDYYDDIGWTDFTHEESGAEVLKAQHPDFETWSQGIHAANGVTCADCHMAYGREGAAKVSNHQIMSPMASEETINASCLTCHHSSAEEMRQRVDTIQTTWQSSLNVSFTALDALITDITTAVDNGSADEADLEKARDYQRKAQFVVDYSFSENGRGFHAPAYSVSILNQATDWARSGQLVLRGIEVDNGVGPAIPEQHMPSDDD